MKFRVASIFSDNMVLQRDKKVCIFGEAEDNALITVNYSDYAASVVASNGRFKLWLPAMPATIYESDDVMSCGSDMTITAQFPSDRGEAGSESFSVAGGSVEESLYRPETAEVIFKNVVVGEVWLAGGQSNMEYELQNMTGAEEIFEGRDAGSAYNDHVRFYYTQKKSYIDEDFLKSESETRWEVFTDEGVKVWSAAGFLFARQLAEKLGVVVGVVGCNWGGTSASHWIDRESILSNEETRIYVDEYDEKTKDKTPEEQKEEYDKYVEHITWWDAEAKKIWAVRPDASWDELIEKLGPNQWPGPVCMFTPFRPAGLYECMISRIMPYTLRGVIYYQGESDDHRPDSYHALFSILIRKWREYFEDPELPFIHVQLPCCRYGVDPDWKNWPPIREAQMKVFKEGLADGIAVAIDCGEFNDIHPKDKRVVADRLAKQALYKVYGLIPEREAFGPILDKAVDAEEYYGMMGEMTDGTAVDKVAANSGDNPAPDSNDNRLYLIFDHAGQGFVIKNYNQSDLPGAHETDIINNDGIVGFEIAGEDKEFVPAHVEIPGMITEKKMVIDNHMVSDSNVINDEQKNVIILSSDKVPEPRYARYIWTNYGTASLYGAASDIPMAPFNTAI